MTSEPTPQIWTFAGNRQAIPFGNAECCMHLIAIVREQSQTIGRLEAEIGQLKSTASSAMVKHAQGQKILHEIGEAGAVVALGLAPFLGGTPAGVCDHVGVPSNIHAGE